MIWLDLDGVLFDFDAQYCRHFGVRPTRWPAPDSVNWDLVRSVPDFFRKLPLMDGARELYTAARCLDTTGVITGCPKQIPAVGEQKREAVQEHFPEMWAVRTCASREKYQHGKPGDILVDDYLKYRHLWVQMGGIFIHHTSAAESISALIKHYRRY